MISRILRVLALAALPFLFAACAVTPAHEPGELGELGRQFTATVPGTWSAESSMNGLRLRMIKQFSADGTARGVLIPTRRAPGMSLVMPEIPFQSRWRVKGDVVETYAVRCGIPGLFKPGQVIRDKLLTVAPNRIVSVPEKGGMMETLRRVGH